jgi:uncharacterized membrane protein (DUF4010 family)
MLDVSLGFDLLVAALVGLAVGLEREWSGHSVGPDARFAGLRTFTLFGIIGGFAGWFIVLDQPLIAMCLAGGAILFAIVAYAATMRRPGTTADGTTEVAAVLVVAIGVAAGSGHRTIASAAGVLQVVLLAEKSAFQRAMQRIDVAELRATVQFAAMALVILPILPDRAFGPYGAFQPRQLWIVVLLFSALNFAGYIARRLVGETRGLGITGLLGGLVSSTAVTLSFSRRSRLEPQFAAPLALGVAAACTVLLPRVFIIATALQPALLPELLPLLGPSFVVGLAVLLVALWRERETRPSDTALPALEGLDPMSTGANRNPLQLGTSIQMAVAFQAVLFAIAWIQATVGSPGVLVSAALLGLTDMDALTLSMTRLASDLTETHVAALAIGIGVIANTVLKLSVALVIGAARYRMRAGAALAVLGATGAAALWWRW